MMTDIPTGMQSQEMWKALQFPEKNARGSSSIQVDIDSLQDFTTSKNRNS